MNESELLDLAHLRALTLVAGTGSATGAAHALYRSQSAISRSLQNLESVLGERLFERKPSGMLPTPSGQTVLLRSERVFAVLEELAQWSAAQRPGKRGPSDGALRGYLLNTRRLEIFVTLARHRHMPTAAHELGISQPAVSSAIRVLESGSGLRLFHRSARGILLTPEGEGFLLRTRRAMNELRHVRDDVAAFQGTIRGVVAVGALPLGRTRILPDAISRVTTQHPLVRVITDDSAYESLVLRLRAGDVDFILGALHGDDRASGLEEEHLLSEDMSVIARPDHPLARKRKLTVADLADVQWIAPRRGTSRHIFDSQFRRLKLKPPQPTVETADLAVIRRLLTRTDMVAVVSSEQFARECELGHLVPLDVVLPNSRRDVGLILRAGSRPSPAARALIDAIRLTSVDVARDVRSGTSSLAAGAVPVSAPADSPINLAMAPTEP